MATSEFQARALYDFVGESSTELSFNAGETLTITTAADGQAWWYARNTAGQMGAIPSNYIEVIQATSDPSAFVDSNDYANFDPNNMAYQQMPAQANYELQSQQYSNPTDDFDWLSNDTATPALPDQQSILNDRAVSFDSSFDTSSAGIENAFNFPPATQPPTDQYSMAIDTSRASEPIPTSLVNPFVVQNEDFDQPDAWYANYPQPAATVLPPHPSVAPNLLSPFGNVQQQPPPPQASYGGNFTFPTTVQNDSVYETPYYVTAPSNPISPAPADNLMSLASPPPTTPPKVNVDNSPASPAPKVKPEKSGFFTLRRQKPKAESEKRLSLADTFSEPSTHQSKDDSDSDGFTESGSSAQHAASNKAAADAKAATKARFFDKHGIDNYILHGCKVKAEEHVEIAYDEKDGGVHWTNNPNALPFSCKVEDPSKGTKLGGFKTFMEYKVHPQIPGARVVGRRYKQFDWLHEQLVNKYRFICVPPLPGKQIAGRFENEFIEERRRQLELWLNRICRHPVLCASFPVQHFVLCELTEKNNKDWKAGKRRSEKDELREAAWLHCVNFTNSNLTETQIATQVDAFAQQQPGLETHLRNLNQWLTKYLERHTEVYEKDMQRLGELFSKLFMAMQTDTTTTGNKELAVAMSKIGTAFNGMAELYKTKSSEDIRNFNERIQDYIGILCGFPVIFNMHRSALDFVRSIQQRGPTGMPDFAGAINRSQVLNHVILAEINFFQKEKVNDFNAYLKELLHEQIHFYENMTLELREAEAAFN